MTATNDALNGLKLLELIGMTEADARDTVTRAGGTMRVYRGPGDALTLNFFHNRVTVRIDGDHVVDVHHLHT